MKSKFLIIVIGSMALSTPSLLNAGIFSSLFEAEYISVHKNSCENAIKEEISYKSGYEGKSLRSGFIVPDVFNASFLSSRNDNGSILYFYNVRAEGSWHMALEEDFLSPSKGRYSARSPLRKMRLVDSHRVESFGIIDSKDTEFPELYDKQHIEFTGRAYCSFHSEESKNPHAVYVGADS